MLAKKFQRSLLNCQRANRGPPHQGDRGPLKIPGCISAQRQCLPGRAYSRASSTRVNRRRRNFPKGSFSASICPGRQASFPGPSERSHQVSAPLGPKNLSAFRAFRRLPRASCVSLYACCHALVHVSCPRFCRLSTDPSDIPRIAVFHSISGATGQDFTPPFLPVARPGQSLAANFFSPSAPRFPAVPRPCLTDPLF